MAGLLITFEGVEASGKSTQIERLAAALERSGLRVRQTREPGGTALGERIRDLLKDPELGRGMTAETELLLLNASRAQLVREVIRPALDREEIVLCDRFVDSTIAYQVYGRGLDGARAREVVEWATGGLAPDLTFFLAVPRDVSELRQRERSKQLGIGADRFERMDRAFFERVEGGYRRIAAEAPRRVIVLEGERPVDSVAAEIEDRVRLALKSSD